MSKRKIKTVEGRLKALEKENRELTQDLEAVKAGLLTCQLALNPLLRDLADAAGAADIIKGNKTDPGGMFN